MSDGEGDALSNLEIVAMSYDEKVKLLERIAQELLNVRVEFRDATAKYMSLKADIQALNSVKGALQSALRAERAEM